MPSLPGRQGHLFAVTKLDQQWPSLAVSPDPLCSKCPCFLFQAVSDPLTTLQDIEKRLSRPIPAMGADLSLPPHVAEKLKPGAGGTQYGEQHWGDGMYHSSLHNE